MSTNDTINRAVIGDTSGLSIVIGPLMETEDVRTIRPGLALPVIAQAFTFTRPNPDYDATKPVNTKTNPATVSETETITFIPEGIARGLVAPSTVKDPVMTEFVYYTTSGLRIPYVYENGAVKTRDGLGVPKDAEIKRPFQDMGTGKQGDGRLGGLLSTVATTLWTTALPNYFLNVTKPVPGESTSMTGAAAYEAIRKGAEVGVEQDIAGQLAGLANLPEEMREQVKVAMKLTDADIIARKKAAGDAAVAAKRAEVVAKNATMKGPKVDPDTLSMAS